MKRILALISALALLACQGCSDKKDNSESSLEESLVSGEISDSGETPEDNAPAVTDKAKSTKEKGSSEKDNSSTASSSQTGDDQKSGGDADPARVYDTGEFTDVKMNLNIADVENAANIQKLELDFAEFGDGMVGSIAYSGDALWIYYMTMDDVKIVRCDTASGKLSSLAEYDPTNDVTPVDVSYACGKLLCNVYDTTSMEFSGIGEIDQSDGSVSMICGSEYGSLEFAADDQVTLSDVEWEEGQVSTNVPTKFYSLDPDTGSAELLYDGNYFDRFREYPGKKSIVETVEDPEYDTVCSSFATDDYTISPDCKAQLSTATRHSATFLESITFSSDVTKRLHTYDLRNMEHLIINCTSLPDSFISAGNDLICYDPRGLIKTAYCVCPLIGTAFRLEGLNCENSMPVIALNNDSAVVGARSETVGDSSTAVYYIIN